VPPFLLLLLVDLAASEPLIQDLERAAALRSVRIPPTFIGSDHEHRAHPLRLRIGINSGPIVAGIIGSHKFAYGLWGDTVNTASRMESTGVPGAIQVSSATHGLIKDRFVCESRGMIPVKGKGEMEAFLLVSRKDQQR